MSDNEKLYCLVAFILGWLTSRMMGNGFSIGGDEKPKGKCIFDEKFDWAQANPGPSREGWVISDEVKAYNISKCTGNGSSNSDCKNKNKEYYPWCILDTETNQDK